MLVTYFCSISKSSSIDNSQISHMLRQVGNCVKGFTLVAWCGQKWLQNYQTLFATSLHLRGCSWCLDCMACAEKCDAHWKSPRYADQHGFDLEQWIKKWNHHHKPQQESWTLTNDCRRGQKQAVLKTMRTRSGQKVSTSMGTEKILKVSKAWK